MIDSAYVLDDDTTAEMNEEEALEVEKVRPQVEVLVHSFMQAALFQRNARGRYAITHFLRRFAMALMEFGVQAEVSDLLIRLRVTVGFRACQVSIDRIARNHERDRDRPRCAPVTCLGPCSPGVSTGCLLWLATPV